MRRRRCGSVDFRASGARGFWGAARLRRLIFRGLCTAPALDKGADSDYRQAYYQQLVRLQAELVKLQDWVVATGEKVLICARLAPR
jgi:hypothetical protein